MLMNWQTNSGRMALKLLPCMVANLRSFFRFLGGNLLRNEELPEESEKRDGSISLSLSLSLFRGSRNKNFTCYCEGEISQYICTSDGLHVFYVFTGTIGKDEPILIKTNLDKWLKHHLEYIRHTPWKTIRLQFQDALEKIFQTSKGFWLSSKKKWI